MSAAAVYPLVNPQGVEVPESAFGGGLVLPYLERVPELGAEVYIAPTASVIGHVVLGDQASVWFGAVLRGDIADVRLGKGSNVQDNSVLHVGDHDPCIVGDNVVVGHNVNLHGCTVGDDCTIGMGAIVLNKAVIGKGSIVGAGALVTQGTIVPPYSLVLGAPAKVKRPLTPEEIEHQAVFAPKYIKVAQNYLKTAEAAQK
jgi:carbonic anhydrase/acetyltransferase-like protein (isoleucine patch superfamily)